jgi:hypothetical protein
MIEPHHPWSRLLAQYPCPPRSCCVQGCVALIPDTPYAYVCGGMGLLCVDVSDPSNPTKVGDWTSLPLTST